jgi:hypothetical protein
LSKVQAPFLDSENFVVSEEQGTLAIKLTPYQRLLIGKRWRPFMDPGLSFLLSYEKLETVLTGHLNITPEKLLEKIRGDTKEATDLWKKCAVFPQIPEEIRKEVEAAGRRVLALGLDLHKEVVGHGWEKRDLSLQMEGPFARLEH